MLGDIPEMINLNLFKTIIIIQTQPILKPKMILFFLIHFHIFIHSKKTL